MLPMIGLDRGGTATCAVPVQRTVHHRVLLSSVLLMWCGCVRSGVEWNECGGGDRTDLLRAQADPEEGVQDGLE